MSGWSKEMQRALEADAEKLRQLTGEDHSVEFFDFEDDYCPNCGGEGVIYMCHSEYACIDPEGGCDMCERRCDWCQPTRPQQPEANGGNG